MAAASTLAAIAGRKAKFVTIQTFSCCPAISLMNQRRIFVTTALPALRWQLHGLR
jgi:hypothetical protein